VFYEKLCLDLEAIGKKLDVSVESPKEAKKLVKDAKKCTEGFSKLARRVNGTLYASAIVTGLSLAVPPLYNAVEKNRSWAETKLIGESATQAVIEKEVRAEIEKRLAKNVHPLVPKVAEVFLANRGAITLNLSEKINLEKINLVFEGLLKNNGLSLNKAIKQATLEVTIAQTPKGRVADDWFLETLKKPVNDPDREKLREGITQSVFLKAFHEVIHDQAEYHNLIKEATKQGINKQLEKAFDL
jgi:hypothetical protein